MRLVPMAAAALSLAVLCRGDTVPVTTDLWDIAQGAVVTGWSNAPLVVGAMSGMFGGCEGHPAEPCNAMFWDGLNPGDTHWVEWRTPAPVVITGFNFFAMHDSPQGDPLQYPRSLDFFALFYKDPGGNWVEMYNSGTSIAVPYEPRFLVMSGAVATAPATDFRAEFRSSLLSHEWWDGPRIEELDGFGYVAEIPEPLGGALAGIGLALLAAGRRFARARR